ncbi:NAD(P)-dependent oxidoreductase [Mycobacterium asiaticum]|uniref:6-phosphogluconate dehydrogenase n=1 Tax=Mycobacterium asiaticum TaxID=1790 RepID=A0A1A3KQL3_MYCAS|nr:NAD(P)-dependent oxidoreductase [Mycobacterium asiaticum]OBJ87492.1 6-phosphogluconate dehydrogenase [Mycobacterium asiaticum]
MRVGFIGLGNQGGPMARRIIDAGFPTTLWARRTATLEPFADTTAKPASSPAELAAASDLVCVCVTGDTDVEQVLVGGGVLSAMPPDGVVAVHSTVHPDTCHDLAQQAGQHGVWLIDAPVSGGGPAAAQGRLLVMAGGDADVVQRCRPVFESFSDAVIHLGDLGSGQTAKLLNNLLFTANLGTAAAALALAADLGVAPERLAAVVSRSSGNSFALKSIGKTGGLERLAGLAGTLLRKDVRLLADLAEQASASGGVALDAADAALTLMDVAR